MTSPVIRFFHGFRHAWKGIAHVVAHERNAKVHLVATAVVLVAGAMVGLSAVEWAVLLLAIAMVIAAECMNTAFERLVDVVDPEHNPQLGLVKDIAAGSVLVLAAGAAAIGVLVFSHRVF